MDVIVGNPPFLGGNRIRQGVGDEYLEALLPFTTDVSRFCRSGVLLVRESQSTDRSRKGEAGWATGDELNSRRG